MNTTLTNELDVLNHALGLLGQPEVNSFDPYGAINPETKAGQKVALFYKEIVDEVQQSFFWQELIQTDALTPEVSDDDFGRKIYDLSGISNLLRPMGVIATSVNSTAVTGSRNVNQLDRHPQDSNIRFTIAGSKLYTVADAINFSYVKREVDPANWSSELGRSIYYNLAVMSAHSVTNDPNVLNALFERYEMLIKPTQISLQLNYKTNDSNIMEGDRNGALPMMQRSQSNQ